MGVQHNTFFWSADTLDWYMWAAKYGDYHAKLAELLCPLLTEGNICDSGYGPGCLSLAFLKHVPEITALDRDTLALDSLRTAGAGEDGLNIVKADAMSLPDEARWDNLISAFLEG